MEESETVYKRILSNYIDPSIKEQELRIENVLMELLNQNTRSLIIIANAFVEELLKNCFYSTMTEKGRKKYNSTNQLNFLINILFAQDYLSEDIFTILDNLRNIRNDFAHKSLLNNGLENRISNWKSEVLEILNNRWLSRFVEKFPKDMPEEQKQFFIIYENLIYGLALLNNFIIPEQKLVRLQFVEGEKYLKVFINVSGFNQYSMGYFDIKYNNTK